MMIDNKLFGNTYISRDDKPRSPIYTRETSQLERIVAQNIYNSQERNEAQLMIQDADLFNWAKANQRVAVAVGTYKQGKENLKLGITLAKEAEIWGVETLRFLEIHAQCKNKMAGRYIENSAIIPIREYADKRGYITKLQRSRFRKQLDVEMLTAQTNTCFLKNDRGQIVKTFSIFKSIEVDPKNNIQITLSDDTMKYCYKGGLIKYSNINKLLLKYPLSYAFADRLETIYSMDSNIKHKRNNIISVENLLDSAKKSIPTEAEAGNKPMQLRGAPIIKALDEMLDKGILTSWEFCGAEKAKMTPDEQAKCAKEYHNFRSAYIHFEMAIAQDETYQTRKDTLEKKNQRTKAKK